MNIRTDLALERAEFLHNNLSGVLLQQEKSDGITVTRMTVESAEAEKALSKPRGRYVTVTVPRFDQSGGLDKGRVALFARELCRLLPKKTESVLVAGLGNTSITPDALGPKTAERVIATRHIGKKLCGELGLGELMPVSVLAPGVLGQTGIETGEIILGTVDRIKPSAVIVIDALAARSLSRLGATVQLSDTGICPGSGVGNSRKEISERTLSVPVISVGIPTVVEIKTLLSDVGASAENPPDMIVTPKEVDMLIDRAAEFLAVGINLCLQKSLSFDDILGLI